MAERESQHPPRMDVMRFTTSGELLNEAHKKVDNFFISNLDYIGFTPDEMSLSVEFIHRWIVQDSYFHLDPAKRVESEDRIKILLAFERPIASALETRTPFNHIQINCVSYLDDQMYLEELRGHLKRQRDGIESMKNAISSSE